MNTDVVMRVHEPPVVKMRYVQAQIKPEQVKDVTPGWEPKTVTPDEGCVLSRVNVAGMPEPTEVAVITENGDHHVERAGIARVQVPIPPGYIIPGGKRVITENGTDIDVRELALVDIVVPVPEMPDEYAIGGSLYNKTLVKYHFPANSTEDNLKQGQFSGCVNLEAFENFPNFVTSIPTNFAYECAKLDMESIPEGVTTIGQAAFIWCRSLSLTTLPASLTGLGVNSFNGCVNLRISRLPVGLTSIGTSTFTGCVNCTFSEIPTGVTSISGSAFRDCTGLTALRFLGNITSIGGQYAFAGCVNCLVYDFRNCTAIPTLGNKNAFTDISQDAVIVVPDSLVASWKSVTNWITYADKIVGVSDYDNS